METKIPHTKNEAFALLDTMLSNTKGTVPVVI